MEFPYIPCEWQSYVNRFDPRASSCPWRAKYIATIPDREKPINVCGNCKETLRRAFGRDKVGLVKIHQRGKGTPRR